ncbi:MAG: prolipoprotein diacylglyceryl transferase [Actinobacteria bacterium]|nr:MAG: prolipoprotein diacylglyceryl transferase [Actinomycetota bacterium]
MNPLASIPSPSSGQITLGPLALHAYGVMLLLGILAAVWLTHRRWVAWGGRGDLVYSMAMVGVAAGIVGARLYHVVTSWSEVPNPKWEGAFEIWKGGLGVWGGVAFGVLAGAWVVRRAGANVYLMMDAVAPGILLAQGIGRIGNYFNQELFGKPTSLPWGLEINRDNRPVGYEQYSTFHPTFLYELCWDTVGVLLLIWIGRRFRIRPPGIFCLYVAYYTFGRFFEELLRIDPAHHFAGLRLNAWVSIVVFVLAVAGFVWSQRRGEEKPSGPAVRAAPRGPRMAIPKGRVRPGR